MRCTHLNEPEIEKQRSPVGRLRQPSRETPLAIVESHATNGPNGKCNIAVLFAAVMLRLRAGYVSKAAILTSAGHSVTVGNRSFA